MSQSTAGKLLFDPFQVSLIGDWVISEGVAKVALQFPNFLYPYATRITTEIYSYISTISTIQPQKPGLPLIKPPRLFILADSKYANSSPDYTAAAHIEADSLVHFGPCSFTISHSIPTLYIFPQTNIFINSELTSFDVICQSLKTSLSDLNLFVSKPLPLAQDPSSSSSSSSHKTIQLTFDSTCLLFIQSLYSIIQSHIDAEIIWSFNNSDTFFEENCHLDARISKSFIQQLQLQDQAQSNADNIVFMTLSLLESCPEFANVYLSNSQSSVYGFSLPKLQFVEAYKIHRRLISQRYRMVGIIEKASIIGILVGNLALDGIYEKVESLKCLIAQSDKSSLVLSVGKLNEPKLINIPEIDIYVYLAPPADSLFDPRLFKRDIAVPFELATALIPDFEWDSYTLDSTTVFSVIDAHLEQELEQSGSDSQVSTSTALIPSITMTTDIIRQNNVIQAFNRVRSSWKGLDPAIESPISKFSMGLTGIAAEYSQISENENLS